MSRGLRRLLETVSVADVAAGTLPKHVLALAAEYETAVAEQPPGQTARSKSAR